MCVFFVASVWVGVCVCAEGVYTVGYSCLWPEVELILAGSPTLWSFGLKGGVIILIWP